ncbi:MAG TPA: hypothetical protein DIC64_03920 [Alphaproteobacteria bacterium]|nr:hypothetical protein [Alphaproteobacteria bacterium]
MTKAIELLKKAREKSGIASGFLGNPSDEKHKEVNEFRENPEYQKFGPYLDRLARKNYNRIAHPITKDLKSPKKFLEFVEQHQKAIKQALISGKINKGR